MNCGTALATSDKWPLEGGCLYPGSAVCLFSNLAGSIKKGINESKQTFGQDMHFYEVNSSLGKERRLWSKRSLIAEIWLREQFHLFRTQSLAGSSLEWFKKSAQQKGHRQEGVTTAETFNSSEVNRFIFKTGNILQCWHLLPSGINVVGPCGRLGMFFLGFLPSLAKKGRKPAFFFYHLFVFPISSASNGKKWLEKSQKRG